jgi:hypothetical protein
MEAKGPRLRSYSVDKCPRCGERHRYAIEVQEDEQASLLFAGPGNENRVPPTAENDGGERISVGLICPNTRVLYVQELTMRPGDRFIRIADPWVARAQPQADLPIDEEQEFVAWKQTSRDVAYRYCSTMQTTSSAAIPVYFVILAYVGHAKVSQTVFGILTLLPPGLLLASLVVFSLAQRPRLARSTQSSFIKIREDRLRRLDRSITAGNTLFVLGTAAASILFWVGLHLK